MERTCPLALCFRNGSCSELQSVLRFGIYHTYRQKYRFLALDIIGHRRCALDSDGQQRLIHMFHSPINHKLQYHDLNTAVASTSQPRAFYPSTFEYHHLYTHDKHDAKGLYTKNIRCVPTPEPRKPGLRSISPPQQILFCRGSATLNSNPDHGHGSHTRHQPTTTCLRPCHFSEFALLQVRVPRVTDNCP